MPSFSSLIRSSRSNSSSQEHNRNHDIVSNTHEKEQRRQSKRDFFRGLIKRDSNRRSSFQFGERFGATSPKPSLTSPNPSSMPDPNKPLPPAPVNDFNSIQEEQELVIRPAKHLERIISPISPAELEKLFSGAPQFFAHTKGHTVGVPHPTVEFPWDDERLIRDLSDHTPILDVAWATVTAWPHVTRDIAYDIEAVEKHNEKLNTQFKPDCRERPNMLSSQGVERGTIGFAAALDLGIADALKEETEVYRPGEDPVILRNIRKDYLKERTAPKMGSPLILKNSLVEVSKAYHEGDNRSLMELWSSLFLKIKPPTRVGDHNDPYSLQIQINELVKVLATPNVWIDFSLVDQRIKLGQILWGLPHILDEEHVSNNNQGINQVLNEKYWLLFQILLSCELLLRLDAIASRADSRLEAAIIKDFKLSEKLSSDSIRWSLLLARHWLENIKIEERSLDIPEPKATWVGTLYGMMAPSPDPNEIQDPARINVDDIKFGGRNQQRQLDGLLHFGRELKWPNIDDNINTSGITMSSVSTPAQTPMSQGSNSYFGRRSENNGSLSQRMSTSLAPEGWLSNTYLSGLILPGEGLNHFLLSTLLENDSVAILSLGRDACLYGGFKYSNRSFWSKECIVGRVLAAGKGARECMGWISSPVTPKGLKHSEDAWVDIEVEYHSKSKTPRILYGQEIERDGHVIGGADSSSVLPGDFVLPSEEPSISEALSVNLTSLDLAVTDDSNSVIGTPTDIDNRPSIMTYSAMMRFSIDTDGEDKREVNLELEHNINFVSAYPCVTSPDAMKLASHGNMLNNSYSPTGSPRDFTGHPLHKAFTYTKIPLSSLLFSQQQTIESLLSPSTSPTVAAHSSTHTTNSKIPKVLIIDCIDSTTVAFPIRPSPSPRASCNKSNAFGSDMEILARAVCAERGWDAVVSRRGRVCLACSVREAAALGWRVIIRLG